MLDKTIEELRAMVGLVRMAKDPEHLPVYRHSYLMFAVMHACQASVLGDSELHRYGFTIHDYKYELIKAAELVMTGKPIDEAIAGLQEYLPATPIDWNYFSEKG